MRNFTKLVPTLWRDRRFKALPSSDAQLVYLFLMSSEHQNSAGAFRLPTLYACNDLGWEEARFVQARDEVVTSGLTVFDGDTEEYFCHGWFEANAANNPKHAISIMRAISTLESDPVREVAEEEFNASEEAKASAREASSNVHPLPNYDRLTTTKFMKGGR